MTMARALRRVIRRAAPEDRAVDVIARPLAPAPVESLPTAAAADPGSVEIADSDPLLAFLQSAPGPVDLDRLTLDSPAVRRLRESGIRLVVPLVSQGELIGTLNLGPRLSEQDYSTDDRRLLANLAAQAAPALRVGQLVREQEAEARERQRMEQELQVAQLIQRNFLPHRMPEIAGWRLNAYYQPARAVGGDFYDCFALPDGRLAVVIGDVTDKGVPAALVMAAARTLLRASAQRLVDPGAVLERVNDLLCPDMPERMFVTCLYGALEPASGRFRFANAGHDLPYLRTADGAVEMRATGMPLGLMPGMTYEEAEVTIQPGQLALLHSDGIAEAHDRTHAMFGFPRLCGVVARTRADAPIVDQLLHALAEFTGPGWDQEDDITIVTIEREREVSGPIVPDRDGSRAPAAGATDDRVLLEIELPSAPGNERVAIGAVEEAVKGLALLPDRLERLKTATAEATMNAIEHGNAGDPAKSVRVSVRTDGRRLVVDVRDSGGDRPLLDLAAMEQPDLEAKLAGLQTPRGWGLFLIRNMVDGMDLRSVPGGHLLEFSLDLEGAREGGSRDGH